AWTRCLSLTRRNCDESLPLTRRTITRGARIYRFARMRQYIAGSSGKVRSSPCPSYPGCITGTRGYDYRKGQGEFPAEQPNDLPLSPTAEAFYRSGPTFWQRYTSFWFSSLLNRIVFFVIPIIAMLIPAIGFAPRIYRWLFVRRIDRLHRALGYLE